MISFACPACRHKLKARLTAAGKKVSCPRCQQTIPVPTVEALPVASLSRTEGATATPEHAEVRNGTAALSGAASDSLMSSEAATAALPALPSEQPTCAAVPSGEEPKTTAPLSVGDGQELYSFLAPAEAPGELGRLGPYRVLKLLGAGGMGAVFHARDPQLERNVALKVMLPGQSGEVGRQRFLREARAVAAIEHDHIIPIFQVGEDRGVPFLAMPLLQGEPLDVCLKREGKLPVAEVLRIGREVALGLAAAHERGLIHRDIKPANLWLEARTRRIKILDFGLARAAGGETTPPATDTEAGSSSCVNSDATAQLTQQGAVVGTPSYMAPEQVGGQSLDHRCDLFSLGCVLYVLSTGKLPFQGKDTLSILMAVAGDDPPPPRQLNPKIPPALSALILRLLAKKPDHRPASATEVAETLAELEQAQRSPRWRLRVAILGGVTAVALLVMALLLVKWNPSPGETSPSAAAGQGSGLANALLNTKAPEIKVPDPAELAARPSAADALKREDLPREVLAFVGGGDPAKAPAELVAVLGDVRFRRHGGGGFPAWSRDGKRTYAASGFDIIEFDVETGLSLRRFRTQNPSNLALEVSPDGSKLVSTGWNNTVQLWDLKTGDAVHTWRTPNSDNHSATFSPDGTAVAAIDNQGKIRLWDTASGNLKREWIGHNAHGYGAAIHPKGHILATSAVDGHVCLWSLPKGDLLRVLPHSVGPSPANHLFIAFSPDGERLASSSETAVKLWDVNGLEKDDAELWSAKTAAAGLLAFAPDSRSVWTTRHHDPDHILTRWDVQTGKAVATLKTDVVGGDWASYRLSPDGRWIFGGSANHMTLNLLDAATGKPRFPPSGHTGPVQGVAFSPDGRLLFSGGDDCTARSWDLATGREIRIFRGHTRKIDALALSPDGCILATGGWDNCVRLWNATEGKQLPPLPHPNGLSSLAFSPSGEYLASGAWDRIARLWHVPSRSLAHELTGHTDVVWGVAFHPSGDQLATAAGSPDGTVRLWNVHNGQPQFTLRGHQGGLDGTPPGITGLAVLPDGRTLVSSGQDNTVRVWSWDGGPPLQTLPGLTGQSNLAIRPDGRMLAARSGGDGTAHLWDLNTTPPRHKFFRLDPNVAWLHGIAFGPEGRYLAVGRHDGLICILRLAERGQVARLAD